MASDNSSEGLPPGWEELMAHAQHTGSAGQPGTDPTPSTPPDEFIEDMDVPLESLSDSRRETKMKGEEQAMRGAGSGVTEEPEMEEEHARGRGCPGGPEEPKEKKEGQDRTSSDNSSEGLPPGWEELVAHARLTGFTGQPGGNPTTSTPPDEFIKDMDLPLESSSDSRCETKMKGEEQATSGAGFGVPKEPKIGEEEHARGRVCPGEPEVPKVKKEDVLIEDINVLELSNGSMGKDGRLDLTFEDYDDNGIPKPDPDLYEVEPEDAGERWSLRKEPAPARGRVRRSSEEYNDVPKEAGDSRLSPRKKLTPARGSVRQRAVPSSVDV